MSQRLSEDFGEIAKLLVHPARFERATPAFGGQYSIQLSYGCLGVLWNLSTALLLYNMNRDVAVLSERIAMILHVLDYVHARSASSWL
jgi:hypothetical protein